MNEIFYSILTSKKCLFSVKFDKSVDSVALTANKQADGDDEQLPDISIGDTSSPKPQDPNIIRKVKQPVNKYSLRNLHFERLCHFLFYREILLPISL